MRGWQRLRSVTLAIMLLGPLSIAARSEARSLTDALVKGYQGTSRTFLLNPSSFCPCNFAQSLASALSTATSQAITQDVPVASVAPAFSYRYNPALGIFERSTGMLGPLFAERALTIGKGKFNFSIGYAWVGFDDINGTNLNNLRTGPGVLLTNQRNAAQLRTSLDIQTQVFAPTFRYGITDDLDLSLVIPILNTSLRIQNTTVMVAEQINSNLFVGTGPSVVGQPVRSAESATGVGDIILRAKYNFWRDEGGVAAYGLSLLLPSGNEDDLQGTGETHVIPSLIVSQVIWDRLEPHINLGIDFNADDVDRSSFTYVAGATLQARYPFALMIDVIGRSEFNGLQVNKNKLAADGLLLNKPVGQCTQGVPCSGQATKVSIFPENFAQRNDIVNFALGLRYALRESGSVYFGLVVPLNNDGFRSDFIPSGGIEYTF